MIAEISKRNKKMFVMSMFVLVLSNINKVTYGTVKIPK